MTKQDQGSSSLVDYTHADRSGLDDCFVHLRNLSTFISDLSGRAKWCRRRDRLLRVAICVTIIVAENQLRQDSVTKNVTERLTVKTDGRLARMLHVLVHMGLLGGRETSERIAQMLNTNPVVVRRTLGALRDEGIVESEGGRGGGWKLARPLDKITVLNVQRALNAGMILPAPTSNDHPACPVEKASNAIIEKAHAAAEAELLAVYASSTLAQIAQFALAENGQQSA